MIDELRAMAIFAETIKQGSFRGAAKTLKLSPSVVSYQISQLEKTLETALIYRSTRSLSLTSEGRELYQHALAMLQAAHQGLNQVTSSKESLTGSISVTLPSALIRSVLSKKIALFIRKHPLLAINLTYTDTRKALIEEGVDLAFRAGEMPDSTLLSKRVGEIKRKLVCSNEFFKQAKQPISLNDVSQLNWIKLAMLPNRRTLFNAKKQKIDIHFTSHICVNNVEAMAQLCINGAGIATPPDFLINDALRTNALIELLPEWTVEPIPLYAVWPSHIFQKSPAKKLLDFVAKS